MSKYNIKPKPNHPCKKDCPDRAMGCAVTCIQWKIYEKEREEFYESKIKDNDSIQSTIAAGRMYDIYN